jgi:hypothetical protein
MLKILFEEKQPSLFGWSITDEEITLQRKDNSQSYKTFIYVSDEGAS